LLYFIFCILSILTSIKLFYTETQIIVQFQTWADKIRKAQHAYKQAKSAAKAAETAAALAAGMMHPEMTDDGIEDSAHCFTLSTGARSHGSSRMPSLFHSHR